MHKNTQASLLIALPLGLSLLFMSCDLQPQGPHGKDQSAMEAIGVPVLFWADKNDVCAQKQLDSIINEFSAATDLEKGSVKKYLSQFTALIFQPSTIHAPITGRTITLKWTGDPDESSGESVTQTKTLVDTRKLTDMPESMKSISEKYLNITAEIAEDHATHKAYVATDGKTFDSITDEGSLILAIENATVKEIAQDADSTASTNSPKECGTLLHLASFEAETVLP